MSTCAARTDSPIGPLVVLVDGDGALKRILFAHEAVPAKGIEWSEERCAPVLAQLADYFAGTRNDFDLPLAPEGTPFQRRVWEELRRIPAGETISYRALAERIGRPSAARAVGRANGTNPIPIVVPCHRVIGANGTLTGYAGGLPAKETLLALEGARR
ncbi:MAG TPA: methylated-DNA--[protein]-cysteine S-methyltransferase [Longimicrobium sp.]|nr:methylated-DNA--[protein]-cysteine S-methyltransferase [Longimicrobium sp.]